VLGIPHVTAVRTDTRALHYLLLLPLR